MRYKVTNDFEIERMKSLGGPKLENRFLRLKMGDVAHLVAGSSPATLMIGAGDTEARFPVIIQAAARAITLTAHAGWGDVKQSILLTETPCHFGGHRKWFLCPDCDRRCGILYLTEHFACRTCSDLTYASQYESPRERMRRRLLKIRKLIGPDLIIGHPLNPPPAGMSVPRWRELVEEYGELRKQYLRECEKPCAWRNGAPRSKDWSPSEKAVGALPVSLGVAL